METITSEGLYRRLQQHLDKMPVAFPATESGVEIRILRRLFNPEEAEIALELSAIPEPAATIHKRIGERIPLAQLTRKLDEMAAKGIIMAYSAGGEFRYGKLMWVIGIYERQAKRLTPEFERDCRQYLEEAFGRALHTGKTPQLRVVPVSRTVTVDRNVATHDQIRAFVEASPGPFAAIPCICRHGKDVLGDSCKQTKLRDNCLMLGMAARWAVDSGTGHALSREEMLSLLDQADEEGLVLEAENTQSPMFVCCCCGCCCGVLTSAKRLPDPATYFRSNFRAVVEEGACEVCGTCVVRCQMEAITTPEDTAVVDRTRCIGCGLCVPTCPSGAMRMEVKESGQIPPVDTKALYLRMFQDRFGALGLAKLGLKKSLGMKV